MQALKTPEGRKKAAKIAGGIALVAAAGGALGYLLLKKKKEKEALAAWNRFDEVDSETGELKVAGATKDVENVELESVCKQMCADDPTCRACSYMPSAKRCKLLPDDPYTATWVESPLSVTLVKREVSEAESMFGDWSPNACPLDCNPDPSPRKRSCLGGGKCVGPLQSACQAVPCDPFDEIQVGFAPPPGDVAGWFNTTTASAAECRSFCARTPTCTGYAYDSSAKKCYTSPASKAISSVAPYPASKLGFGIRSQAGWDALPANLATPCKVGMGQWERGCPGGGCTLGVKTVGCAAKAAGWDRFVDVRY
jgi:hypothetical protein